MTKPVDVKLHENDLPGGLDLGTSVAVDTETMGLDPVRFLARDVSDLLDARSMT